MVAPCIQYLKHALPTGSIGKRSVNKEDIFHCRRLAAQLPTAQDKDDNNKR
jgi:hypothetical protein